MISNLYAYARNICSQLPNTYKDDIIQDAVIYAWGQTQRYTWTTMAFLQNAVRQRVQRCRRTYMTRFRESTGLEALPETGDEGLDAYILSLPLPPDERKLVVCVIENNFEISYAARKLDIPVYVASRMWARACSKLKEVYS